MIAYKYDDSGMYIGVTAAQRDPKKQGSFLLPKNSTFIAPPTGYTEDKQPCFNGDSQEWALVDSEAEKALDHQKMSLTNEYGVSLYYYDENGKPALRDQSEVDTESESIRVQFETDNLRQTMRANIINKAAEVTGGYDIESIQAFISSYQLKKDSPGEYLSDNLQVHYPVGGFEIGDNLDTEEKISTYYNSLLVFMDKFRDAEIQNYKASKASI